jgi:Acyl-protein synthetase, LuxE
MLAERSRLQGEILKVTPDNFEHLALEVFRFQYVHNALYRAWVDGLHIASSKVLKLEQIPFLPISMFKTHSVQTGQWDAEKVFSSSGTTGQVTSNHPLRSVEWYQLIAKLGFEKFYGSLRDYAFFALLPSYLERSGSSLVMMVDDFIEASENPGGFYIYDHQRLLSEIALVPNKQVLLIGVTYALLDLAELRPDLSGCIVMETGGMKGQRKEMIREEVHEILSKGLQVPAVHSEYGMTELLSQAYSRGKGIFECANTLKIVVRESTDPMQILPPGRHGLINAIDLGNLDSCAFIATDDVGIVYPDGSFKVLGRMDGADVRGCNLMVV